MHIQVSSVEETPRFPSFVAEVPQQATVLELKTVIQSRWKIHPRQQLIIHGSNQLEDDSRQLSSYQITSNAQVSVGAISATIRLFIVPLDSEYKKVRIDEVDLNWTVHRLMVEGSAKLMDLRQTRVQLSLGDVPLKGDELLRTIIGLDNESVLCCVITEIGGSI